MLAMEGRDTMQRRTGPLASPPQERALGRGVSGGTCTAARLAALLLIAACKQPRHIMISP